MTRKCVWLTVLAIVGGCAAKSLLQRYPVSHYRTGEYLVYVESYDPAKAHRVAREVAQDYCTKFGLGHPVAQDSKLEPYGGGWKGGTLQYVFRCE